MTKDETYNGWTNYPTWAVNLWLSNDEALYNEAMERTTLAMASDSLPSAPARVFVADDLRHWVQDDLAPDLDASFASDLLTYALGEVNWEEIATAWIEQVKEQVV